MSKISASLKKAIKEIKEHANGTFNDQLKCSKLLREKIFYYGKPRTGVDESIIRELLPIIIKFMESNDHGLQQESANSITSITNTSDKANTQLVIDAGVIPNLINLLSSKNTDVLISVLEAFRNIAYDFPENVIGILPSIIQYLESKDLKISYQAARFMANISSTSEECIVAIFEANGVKPLIEILESSNYMTGKEILIALRNIISCNYEFCQRVLDLGALKPVKKLCDRLFVAAKKYGKDKSDEEKCIKLLVFQIVNAVTSYGEAQIDLVINENFIPIILQQIKGGSTPQIKIESIKVIENVISNKHGFIRALIQHYNIFSFCYSNLGSSNANLVIASLTVMCNIVELFEGQDIIRQKIRECGGPTKLTSLRQNFHEKIQDLSNMLYDFLLDVKAIPIAEVPVGSNQEEPEVIELSDDEDTPAVGTPQNGRQRKRQGPPSEPLRTSKRLRGSLQQIDIENSGNPADDNENVQYHDFEDYPRSSSIDTTTATATTESSRNGHSGQQSVVDDDTVAADEQFRFLPKIERPPTPNDFDMPTPPSSRQSPDLPVAASINNETTQNVTNHSPPVYRPRFSLNNSFALPVSANNGNIQFNHVGLQAAAVNSETAATADGIVGNSTNPSPSVDFGNPFSRPVSTNSLPEPTSTNNGTAQNVTKHSPSGHSGNRSRPSSNKSRAVPKATSTNEGNFRFNHVGHQPAVNNEIAATANEIFGNSTNPSPSGDFGNPFSRSVLSHSPTLPEPASTNNGTIQNVSQLTNPSPIEQPVITRALPNQATTAVNDDMIRDEIIIYWNPHGSMIHQYCQKLGIQFNRDNYDAFISKIKFTQITSNSKPDNIFQPIDQSGFGCLSILFTGNENGAVKICKEINKQFISTSKLLDKEKLIEVACSEVMLAVHFETIAALLECRILVYCNGWKKYGSWETENSMIPLFVLEKKENGYEIILDLKNNV